MVEEQVKRRIAWYKSPIPRETLAELNQRSDWQGLVMTVGYLGLLVLSGAAVWFAAGRLPPVVVLLLLFLHGPFHRGGCRAPPPGAPKVPPPPPSRPGGRPAAETDAPVLPAQRGREPVGF